LINESSVLTKEEIVLTFQFSAVRNHSIENVWSAMELVSLETSHLVENDFESLVFRFFELFEFVHSLSEPITIAELSLLHWDLFEEISVDGWWSFNHLRSSSDDFSLIDILILSPIIIS